MGIIALALVKEIAAFVQLVDLALAFLLLVRVLLDAVYTSLSTRHGDFKPPQSVQFTLDCTLTSS